MLMPTGALRPRTNSKKLGRSAAAALLIAASCALPLKQALAQQSQAGTPQPLQGFEAYVSQDALQVFYIRDMDVGEFGRNEVRAGFFLNEDRDLIGIADMLVDVGQPTRRPWWSLQVGPRMYGALLTVENDDIFGIGFGGKLSYHIGRDRRTSASVALYYAPDIITFGNADNITDVTVSLETQLTENTRVFVGFRSFEFDVEVDREVDDGVHVGIRHTF